MSEQQLLRSNVMSISPLISDDKNSAFMPQGISKIQDHLYDPRYITATSVCGLGMENTFEISKQASIFTDLTLQITWPSIPVTSGTFVRYVDFLGYAAIESYTCVYVSNKLYQYGGHYLWTRARLNYSNEKRVAINNAVLGERSGAERSALTQSTTPIDTYTNIFYPLGLDLSMPGPSISLAQKLQNIFKLRNMAQLLQTDGNINSYSGFDIDNKSGARLLIGFRHLTEPQANEMVTMTEMDPGLAFLFSNKQLYTPTDVSKGANLTGAVQVQIPNRGALKEYLWYAIPKVLYGQTTNNDWFMVANKPSPVPPGMGTYNRWKQWWITSSGQYLVRTDLTYPRWALNEYHRQIHTSQPGDNINDWSFSIDPEAENAALGYTGIANQDNPTLFVEFDPATGTGINPANQQIQTLVLIQDERQYTFVHFHRGDATEIFV